MDVSVIVPALNEASHLEACITALLGQTYTAGRLEIVVAEGRSTDGTRALLGRLAENHGQLRIVDNPSGRTPDGLNAAIEASRGDVLVRMDAHAIPAPDYVERCIAVLESSGAWCVGGRMVKSGGGAVGGAIAAATSSPFGVGDSTFHYLTSSADVESVYLGCWPRAVFERVGLFDPELVRNQDDEFSFRLRAAGGRIHFDPSINVTYVTRQTFRALFRQHRQYGHWKVRVFQKHPRAVRWRHLVPPLFVGVTVGAPTLGALTRSPLLLGAGLLSVLLYAGAAGVAATALRRNGISRWHAIAAFAAMHSGYGLGFWTGVAAFLPKWLLRQQSSIPHLQPRDRATAG